MITHEIIAAYAYAGESVKEPEKYYFNNVVNTLNLLKVMREFNVNKIIFSSSCATYGDPIEIPMTESHVQNPINPYGKSKLMIEKILLDYAQAYNLKYAILRYFNVVGASPSKKIGQINKNGQLFKNLSLAIKKKKPIFNISPNVNELKL